MKLNHPKARNVSQEVRRMKKESAYEHKDRITKLHWRLINSWKRPEAV